MMMDQDHHLLSGWKLDLWDLQVHKVLQDQVDPLVLRVLQDQQDHRVLQVHKDLQVLKEMMQI
tara:strand:- start:81 stop:269 length:189 start_codon:yes stop_codon:yes gene_type:complete